MRFFNVRLGRDGAERTVRVPSPTSVQAGDAAAALSKPGGTILSIEEAPDDGLHHADGQPPKTQAEELAPITPGSASVER